MSLWISAFGRTDGYKSKMLSNMNQETIAKILSFCFTAACFALFIFLLPSILVVLSAFILLLIIAAFAFKFWLKKEQAKFHFTHPNHNRDDSRTTIHEMKDVTNSAKKTD